jgi:hypothetical protein
MPKKERVHNADQTISNVMDSRLFTNNVSGAGNAASDLFGNVLMSKNAMNFPGSNFGSKKATRSEDSQSFLATAHSKSSKSKIIGLNSFQNMTRISQRFNMPSTMGLISDERAALSRS